MLWKTILIVVLLDPGRMSETERMRGKSTGMEDKNQNYSTWIVSWTQNKKIKNWKLETE